MGARDIFKEIGDSMDQPARSVLLHMRDRLRDWSILLYVSLQKRPEYHFHINLSMLCIDACTLPLFLNGLQIDLRDSASVTT